MSHRSESPSSLQAAHFATEATTAALKSVETDHVARVAHFIRPGQLVADLGSNDGAVADLLSQRKARVIACDFPEVIAHAHRNYPSLACAGFDASGRFPFADRSLDAISACEIIEHIVDDVGFLKECLRVLKPGGNLVLSTPNIAFIRDRIWLLRGYYQDNPMHVHLYTFDNLHERVLRVGFATCHMEGYTYNLTHEGFWGNFRRHWREISLQNALWFLIENLLPRNFRAGIVLCATKR